jgi:hypothetical protein
MAINCLKINVPTHVAGKYRGLLTTAYLKFDGLTTHPVFSAQELLISTCAQITAACGSKSKALLNTLLSHFLPNIECPFLGLLVR